LIIDLSIFPSYNSINISGVFRIVNWKKLPGKFGAFWGKTGEKIDFSQEDITQRHKGHKGHKDHKERKGGCLLSC